MQDYEVDERFRLRQSIKKVQLKSVFASALVVIGSKTFIHVYSLRAGAEPLGYKILNSKEIPSHIFFPNYCKFYLKYDTNTFPHLNAQDQI